MQPVLSALRRDVTVDGMPWRRLLAAAAIGIVMVFSVLWYFKSVPPGPTAQPELIPFTSSGGRVTGNFSPDGRQVVFSWDGERHENPSIYLRAIDSSANVRLTSGAGEDVNPAFSPDGRHIGFIRSRRDSHLPFFMLISPQGGPEQTVAEVPSAGKFAWLSNGKWVVLQGLKLLSLDTGEIRDLTSPPDQAAPDITPAVSPDGHTVAFARKVTRDRHEIFLLDLDQNLLPESSPRRLTSTSANSIGPAWTPDGRQVVYQSSVEWNFSLWRVAVSGPARREHLPFGQGDSCGNPEISRDGKRLLFVRWFQDLDIWRLPLTAPGTPGGPPVRFISSTWDDSMPRYSRDARRIAFNSNRSGKIGVWLSDDQGSATWQVPLKVGMVGSPSWSPDGRNLTYDLNGDVYVAGADGGTPLRLTTAAPSVSNIITEWSHDGKWIYFTKFEAGRPNLWKVPSGGGEAVQLTRAGGGAPEESPDGRFIYYMKDVFSPSPLCRMPSEGGPEVQVLPSVWRLRGYAVVQNGIYFVSGTSPGGRFSIQFLNLANGRIRTVATPPLPLCCGIDVSPDGRFLLYVQRERSGSDLMLVDDYR